MLSLQFLQMSLDFEHHQYNNGLIRPHSKEQMFSSKESLLKSDH